jgi:hypothetical protein
MALAAPMTSAHADFGDTFKGGCGVATAQNSIVAGASQVGIIYDLSVSEHQSGLPSDATVQCWIQINGNDATNPLTVTDDKVPGVEAGARQISYLASDFDSVELCQSVSYPASDGSTWVAPDGNVGTDCQPITTTQTPPQAILDFISFLRSEVNDLALCPVLVAIGQATGGHIAGAIAINPDGDLYVAEPVGPGAIWVYDCAPYGNGVGSPLVGDPTLTTTSIWFLLPPFLPPL